MNRFLDEMADRESEMCAMVDISYLEDPLKARYKEMIKERIRALKYSYKNINR